MPCPIRALTLGGGLLLVVAAGFPSELQAQVAVITHPNSPVLNLSLEELSKIFLGQVAVTAAGPVTLAEHSAVRARFYSAVIGLAEAQVDRHWIGMVFRGGGVSPPRKIADAGAVRDFVVANPGAIAFVDVSAIDGKVRVVTIDGRTPAHPDYPISS